MFFVDYDDLVCGGGGFGIGGDGGSVDGYDGDFGVFYDDCF